MIVRLTLWCAVVTVLVAGLPSRAPAADCADCNGDGAVTIDELITGIGIALGAAELSACPPIDRNGDAAVSIDELVAAIGNALQGCATATTPTPTLTAAPTRVPPSATPTPPGSDSQIPPTEAAALVAWLEAGSYLGWQAESAPHASAGPHFGIVRTFVNNALFDSLSGDHPQHPGGAAAVKELYGSGTTVRGWAVMLKLQDDSNAGRGWYWYERFNGSGSGAIGNRVCTGCHSAGRDFVRIPFPLQ